MSLAYVLRADARHLPLSDASVDLVITSPPYFSHRSYRDGGEHYDGQVGAEATPQEYLAAMWEVMSECWRVLKPTGNCFVNVGDKRAASGGHNNSGVTSKLARRHEAKGIRREPESASRATRRNAPDRYNQAAFGRAKSKMLLPHRFAIGCEDGLADPEGIGWIIRQDGVWSKPNGLPESVDDRCRDAHEYVFHLTRQGNYFTGIDEIREPYADESAKRIAAGFNPTARDLAGAFNNGVQRSRADGGADYDLNPLGTIPSSVWEIPTESLRVSAEVKEFYGLPDHFAAFPPELVRRIVMGFAPRGICTVCGEGRRPITSKSTGGRARDDAGDGGRGKRGVPGYGDIDRTEWSEGVSRQIVGYVCSCCPRTDNTGRRGDWRDGRTEMPEHGSDDWSGHGNAAPRRSGSFGPGGKVPPPAVARVVYHLDRWHPPPIRPAVVLDPFGGTGTTAGVARMLGRVGISVDLSTDYCRLARWRIFESDHFHKSGGLRRPPRQTLGQGSLL